MNVRHQSAVAIIDLHGDINATTGEALNAAYTTAVTENPATILLNFEDVHYITSTGLALIVGLLARALQANLRMAASGLSDHYAETFQITRLTDFMDIFPDEISALAELGKVNSEA
jgi:anti-anti-sigma factor